MTPEQLRAAVGCTPELARLYAPILTDAADRWRIRSTFAVAAWLGQMAVESARLSAVVESLNYSAARLAQVWPNRFRDYNGRPNDLAHRLAGDPEGLANYVYGGRMGNGDEQSGDGWRYRGRGLGQITGRANYRYVSEEIGRDFLSDPMLLELPDYAAETAACWFATRINPGSIARRDVDAISREWNGGSHGLDDRAAFTNRALGVLDAT